MDPLTLIMLAVLAVLIIFMVRNSRKRETEELSQKITEGAYVMTNFGLYGTILSIDVENNVIMLESTPGTIVKVHRQTVTRVVPTEDEAVAIDSTETVDDQTTPEFGERVHEPLLEKKPVDGGTVLNGVPLDENGKPRTSAE